MEMEIDFESIINAIKWKVTAWFNLTVMHLPNFILGILVVFVFSRLAKLVSRLFYRLASRAFDNETVLRVFSTLISSIIFLVGVFIALSILEWDKTVTSLLAGAGVVGLALSFAFQDLATNFISGIFIVAQKPLKLGDLIETNGYMGVVYQVGLRSITLRTLDEQHVIIPSKDVFQHPLKNYMFNSRRRVKVSVGVAYNSNLDLVQKVTLEAVKSVEEVDKNYKIYVNYVEFGGSSINLDVFFWIARSNQGYYLSVQSKVIVAIKKAYDKNDINIPFPIRTIDLSMAKKQGGFRDIE